MKHGGARPGSGRKSKAEELKLIERLSPMQDEALEQINKGIKKGDFAFIKLFMEYLYGKPNEKMDIQMDADVDQNITVEIIRANKNK